MKNEPLKIKKRGEDGTRIITVRIREETLSELDRIANESNDSRNELINLMSVWSSTLSSTHLKEWKHSCLCALSSAILPPASGSEANLPRIVERKIFAPP